MALDKAEVAKIARLARVNVPEAELEPLVRDLNGIIGWVEQLGEVDTKGVEPMAAPGVSELRWREDKVTDGDYPDKVLQNGPETAMGFYTVPKVVE